MNSQEVEKELASMIAHRHLPSYELVSELWSEGLLPIRLFNLCSNAGGGASIAGNKNDRSYREIVAFTEQLLQIRKAKESNQQELNKNYGAEPAATDNAV